MFKIFTMKKILGLLALLLFLGCDDGDMTFQSFDFSGSSLQRCVDSNVMYKANGTEVLILDLDESNFPNAITAINTPRIITVNTSSNIVRYRNYSGPVGNGIICSALPPASPSVSEEWIATGGTIAVTTVAIMDEDDNTVITGYSHVITLQYITFTKGEETIIIQDNLFGSYNADVDYTFNFNDENVVLDQCENEGLIFARQLDEALILDVDQATFFPNEVTPTDTPRIMQLSNDNSLVFNIYDGNTAISNICSAIPPLTPVNTDRWIATEGQLHISTTETDGTYFHTIELINVKFVNTSNPLETFTRTNFVLGDVYSN